MRETAVSNHIEAGISSVAAQLQDPGISMHLRAKSEVLKKLRFNIRATDQAIIPEHCADCTAAAIASPMYFQAHREKISRRSEYPYSAKLDSARVVRKAAEVHK